MPQRCPLDPEWAMLSRTSQRVDGSRPCRGGIRIHIGISAVLSIISPEGIWIPMSATAASAPVRGTLQATGAALLLLLGRRESTMRRRWDAGMTICCASLGSVIVTVRWE